MQAAAPPPAPAERRWYGWQTLIVDGAGLAVGIAASGALRDDLDHPPPGHGMVAASLYGIGAVGAPAVHYAHGNVGLGLADFGARVLVPPLFSLFGVVGACLPRKDAFESDCAEDGFAAGALVGSLAVAGVDAGVLAWERPRPEGPERLWYGWQTLAVDAAALGAGIYYASGEPENESGEALNPALAAWLPLYSIGFFAGPIVHFVHGRIGYGFISFGARAGIGPIAGALPGVMGYCAASAGATDCAADGAQWGLLGGQIAVGLFDAFVLAYEKAEAAPAAAWTPIVELDDERMLLGVAGAW